ncbi:hypothetical protein JCM14076_21070 [Methylosoma difficile]
MATYKYSTYAAASSTSFTGSSGSAPFTTSDIFSFDDETLTASSIVIDNTVVTSPKITIGGKSFTFVNFSIQNISITNFLFGNGSKFQIGDGTSGTLNDDSPNVITGTDFNDYLDGLGGIDTVSYASASWGVTINLLTGVTAGGAGVDKLLNIENATGSAYSDILTASNAGSILDGGLGVDTLTGGTGNDTYMVDAGDVVSETSTATTSSSDLVISSVNYALTANVENLTLTGNAIQGIGNSLNNILIGTTGNNILDGGTGNDAMTGGSGDDTYFVDSTLDTVTELTNGGTDIIYSTVSYTLGSNIENLRLLSGAINGKGNDLNNIIYASSGSNTLDGGSTTATDIDTLSYQYGATAGVTVSLTTTTAQATGGSGSDTISNFENLTGSGYSDNLTGTSGNNTIMGGAGNDTITGLGGTDKLDGGAGNDTYVLTTVTGVTFTDASGIDTVKISETSSIATYTFLENLTLTGTTNINGTGNGNANTLLGNSGNNTLDGGAGNDFLKGNGGTDILMGNTGDDTYIITNASPGTISELASAGTDLVITNVSGTILADNVENLTYGSVTIDSFGVVSAITTGSVAFTATGNASKNIMTGGTANNTLYGLADNDTLIGNIGNDYLDGGTGNDAMSGGAGNDTYIVDSTADTLTEASDGGTDTVQSSITYTLVSNLENLTLTGTTAINGTGSSDNNTLLGNSNNNVLDGGLGNDSMGGGLGDDTYILDNSSDTVTEVASAGTDTIQAGFTYTLLTNFENLTLTGTATINGTGNSVSNVLVGNAANNTLDGGTGADSMSGGLGSDTYVVDNTGDSVTEATGTGSGIDLVQSSVTYTITDTNIENLTLTGTLAINGTGNSAANTLTGNSGDNILDAGVGADAMIGGTGNDTYVVDNTGDTVTEATSAGTDTVQSSITYTLGSNLENLTLTGTATINGTGNSDGNILIGNTANNTLSGGAGADSMSGGTGDDTYVVDNTGDTITEATSAGTDAVQSSITYTLGANVENLTLTGTDVINGTGNSNNNVLVGNTAANTLDGSTGADGMSGGTGNDTYIIDNTGDTVTEAASAGTDTVQSGITYTLGTNLENLTLTGTAAINGTGNSVGNTLTGNTANNTLDGSTGADAMSGGTGNDTYVVDNTGDTVTEATSAGTDTVQSSITYTLGANLENLTLTSTAAINGTGNSINNILTGNTGANTLDGSTGADSMSGNTGNDIYIVDNIDDTVTEVASGGTDTVQSGVTYTISDVNIENLTLTGTLAINGTGNSLGNVLVGNTADNRLDGSTGADGMSGGTGNDTYIVDNTSDTITESASSGTDKVEASVTYTLTSTNLENLTLTGTLAINGTGNSLGNTLTGNTADNVLNGSTGADGMSGGTGNDTYVVDDTGDTVTEAASAGSDTVQSGITYTLGSNLENLTLTSTASINGTGNSTNNTLTGNTGANTLDGSTGADSMSGGTGNDTYVVDNTGDTVTEVASGGTDTVQSAVTYTLSDVNVENLTLTGTAAINGTGNSLGNTLIGNTGNNILTGGAGKDTLTGGTGADTFRFTAASESTTATPDVISDFNRTEGDKIDVNSIFTAAAPTTLRTTAFTNTGTPQVNYISGKISFDITGDGVTDFAITLTGTPTLTLSDFIF